MSKPGWRPRPVSSHWWDDIVADGEPLEFDEHGRQSIALNDGRILKVFRRHQCRYRSYRLHTCVARFANNADRLLAAGFASIVMLDTVVCHSRQRQGAIYQPLPGRSVRQLACAGEPVDMALSASAELLAQLHDRGIGFRGFQLGNVLMLPGGGCALMDVSDISWQRHAMSLRQRQRSFAHLLRYPEDRAIIDRDGLDRFLQAYFAASQLGWWKAEKLRQRIHAADGQATTK